MTRVRGEGAGLVRRLFDARGQVLNITQVDVDGSPDGAGTRRRRARLLQRRARERVTPGEGCVGILVAMVFVVLFLGLMPALLGALPAWLILPAIVLAWLGFAFVLTLTLERIPITRGSRWVNSQVSELGVCYACGYDLVDLPAEGDGCTVCPECGAAWRVDAQEEAK
jgi:hypothetical protein